MFHIRLKELRDSRDDCSQQNLADYLGYSRAAISSYELGRTEPSHEDLRKLADYFGVTVDYLIGHTPKKGAEMLKFPPSLTKEQIALLENFEKLNSEGRQKIMGNIDDFLEIPKYTHIAFEERERHA